MLSWQEECSNPQFKFCQGKEGNDFLKYIFDFKISVYLKGFKVNIKYLLFSLEESSAVTLCAS